MRWIIPLIMVIGLGACMVTPAVRPVPVSTPVKNQVSFTGDYIDIADADIAPRPLARARPIYPVDFRKAGINGEALVEFIIDLDGKPAQVQVLRATDAAFGNSARDSIVQWRFAPALKNGEPVRVRLQVPIVYTVGDD